MRKERSRVREVESEAGTDIEWKSLLTWYYVNIIAYWIEFILQSHWIFVSIICLFTHSAIAAVNTIALKLPIGLEKSVIE